MKSSEPDPAGWPPAVVPAIEMSFRAWKKGFRLKEIPITFTDRTLGQSKMSRAIVWEAVWMVWRLRFASLLGRL